MEFHLCVICSLIIALSNSFDSEGSTGRFCIFRLFRDFHIAHIAIDINKRSLSESRSFVGFLSLSVSVKALMPLSSPMVRRGHGFFEVLLHSHAV